MRLLWTAAFIISISPAMGQDAHGSIPACPADKPVQRMVTGSPSATMTCQMNGTLPLSCPDSGDCSYVYVVPTCPAQPVKPICLSVADEAAAIALGAK